MVKSVKKQNNNSKTWDYFLDLIKTKEFKNEIELIRKSNLEKHKEIDNFIHNKGKLKNNFTLSKEIKRLCVRFGLNDYKWNEVIRNYIVRYSLPNKLNDDLCLVLDKTEFGEYELQDECNIGDFAEDSDFIDNIEMNKAYSHTHPIILRISQYASERDIIDFIKKHYAKQIKPLQNKYKNVSLLIGKVRHKNENKAERNDFIYKNKDLPRREISSLVLKKYGESLDTGHIGKIISLENKKRK